MTTCRPYGLHRALTLAFALAVSGIFLLSATPSRAQGNFPEFGLHTGNVAGHFDYPSAARLSNGTFVVVTQALPRAPADKGAYFRIYNPAGVPLGKFTLVKRQVIVDAPSRVAATGNGFVVVWYHQTDSDMPEELRGQRYSKAGEKVGDEFTINETNPGFITNHQVATLKDGGFVVVWEGEPFANIYARRYDANGNAVTGEFVVNTERRQFQRLPAVAGLSNGRFIIVWSSRGAGGSDIQGQLYKANGEKDGGEFKLTKMTGPENAPAIAAFNGGGFVVAWTTGRRSHNVYGRRFNSAGEPRGQTFLVGGPNRSYEDPLAISVLDDDRFLVAYSKESGDVDWNVYARLFGPTAAQDGDNPEFRVSSADAPSDGVYPAALALSDRSMFAMWTQHNVRGDIRLRRLVFPPAP